MKKGTLVQVLCEFYEIFKNNFFIEHLQKKKKCRKCNVLDKTYQIPEDNQDNFMCDKRLFLLDTPNSDVALQRYSLKRRPENLEIS